MSHVRRSIAAVSVAALLGGCTDAGSRYRYGTPARTDTARTVATASVAPDDSSLQASMERIVTTFAPLLALRDTMVAAINAAKSTNAADSILSLVHFPLSREFSTMTHRVDANDVRVAKSALITHARNPGTAADAEAERIRSFFDERGLWFFVNDTIPYFEISSGTLLRQIDQHIGPVSRQYLRLDSLGQHRPASDDNGSLIPWDELGDRLAAWDSLATGYPTAAVHNLAEAIYAGHLRFYLRGSDTTPVFPNKGLSPMTEEVRASYEQFIKRYAGTRAGALVRTYYEMVRQNGWRDSRRIRDFLRTQPELRDWVREPAGERGGSRG